MSDTARAEQDAAARGIAIEVVTRPASNSLEEAAAVQGIAPADIVKTLVVKRHDGNFLLALIPGDRQIDWAKLRGVVGVNKLRLPDAEDALAATGYARGTISPFGAEGNWPVYADAAITGRRISMGAGAPGRSLWVQADDLIRGYDATVADISKVAG